MLLAGRSVHLASPLHGLSALHNVEGVRAWRWSGTSHPGVIPLRGWTASEGFFFSEGACGLIAALKRSRTFCPRQEGFLTVEVCPLESVAALPPSGPASFPSSSAFINSPFVAPAPRSLPPLPTCSAHLNATDEPLMYRWPSSFRPIKAWCFFSLRYYFNQSFF